MLSATYKKNILNQEKNFNLCELQKKVRLLHVSFCFGNKNIYTIYMLLHKSLCVYFYIKE